MKVEVPASWKDACACDEKKLVTTDRKDLEQYVNNVLNPVNAYQGNKLPVSTFMPHVDGTAPQGSSAFEKRGIAVDVPEWNPQNCIQCNFCSYVCPHAVIRPVAMTADELAAAPEGTEVQGYDRRTRHEVCYDHFRPGLHRLRFLRSGLPGHEG